MPHIPKLSALAEVWTHPANRGRRVRSVSSALAWQLQQRLSPAPKVMTLHSGSRMQCEPQMPAAHLVAAYRGLYDFDEQMFLRSYLRPGDRFLDVGANAGVYALMVGPLIGADGCVDCFEPTPNTRRRLIANLALSGLSQVKVHPFACSDRTGQIAFAATDDDHTNQIASPDAAGTIEVETRRLDDVVGGCDYAVGKLDIEGAEPLALAGAAQMLAAGSPPVWIMELSWRVEQFGWTAVRFADWLADHGFDLLTYDATAKQFRWADTRQHHCNVFAVKRDRRAEVEARLAAE